MKFSVFQSFLGGMALSLGFFRMMCSVDAVAGVKDFRDRKLSGWRGDFEDMTGSVSTDFVNSLERNLKMRCPDPLKYAGGVYVTEWPMAVSLFDSLGYADKLTQLIEDIIDRGFETSDLQPLITNALGWIIAVGIGVMILVVMTGWVCCVCTPMRKCWGAMTCGLCCVDRRRTPIWEIKRWKWATLATYVTILGLGGFLTGVFFCGLSGMRYLDSYEASLCDIEQSTRGAVYGSNGTSAWKAGTFWGGTDYIHKELKLIEDRLRPEVGAVAKEVYALESALEADLVKGNETIFAASAETETLLESTAAKLAALNVDHICLACQNTTMFSDLTSTLDTSLTTALTETRKSVDDIVGVNSEPLKEAVAVASDGRQDIETVNMDIEGLYWDFQDAYTYSDRVAYSISGLYLTSTLVGVAVLVYTIAAYSCLMAARFQKEPPQQTLRNCFACHFCCMGLCAAMGLIIGGLILFILTTGSSGCYVLNKTIIDDGSWSIVNIEGTEDFNLTKVLNTCVSSGGDGDLFGALDIDLTAVTSDLDHQMEVFRNDTDDAFAALNKTGQNEEISSQFVHVSWILLPDPSTLPADYPATLKTTGIQMEDVEINCDDIGSAGSMLGCTLSTDVKTVYGTKSLNSLINTSATSKKWCMKSLEGSTVLGCSSTTPFYIEFGTDADTNADIQAEYNALGGSGTAVADEWLNSVKAAIQKEVLLNNKTFDCSGSPCSAGAYMPYVTPETSNVSPFTTAFDLQADAVGASTGQMVTATETFDVGVTGVLHREAHGRIDGIEKGSNCGFVGQTTRRVADDFCVLALPSSAVYPVGLLVFAGCCLMILPLSWTVYHFIADTMDMEDEDDEEKGTKELVLSPEDGAEILLETDSIVDEDVF